MKQFSLKRLALSAVALLTVGVASAAVETYDFTSVGQNVYPSQTDADKGTICSVNMWLLKYGENTFGNRFATGPDNRTTTAGFYFKNSGSYKGLYSQYSDRNFAIRNLKKGDIIRINWYSYKGSGAVEGADLKFVGVPSLSGVAANASVTSGKLYTVTADGDLMMITAKSSADPEIFISEVKIFTSINYMGDIMNGEISGSKTSYTDGDNFTTCNVKWTFGNDTWTRWNNSSGFTIDGVTHYNRVRGTAQVKVNGTRYRDASPKKAPDTGLYVIIEPEYDGVFTAYGENLQGDIYLVEVNASSDVIAEQKYTGLTKGNYALPFEVEGGKKYYFFNEYYYSGVGYYGFTFRPNFGVKINDGAYTTFGNATVYNFEVPAGLTAYAVEHESKDTKVSLKKVDYINAGQAVMISGTAGSYAFGTTASTDATNFANNKLVAVASDTKIQTNATYTYYIYGKKGTGDAGFYPVSDSKDRTAKAGKAYLRLATDDAPTSAPMLWLNFEDNQTTGVNEVRSKMEEVRGIYYNLAGQRVDNPTKGIYIVNGRKVVIK